MSTNLTVREICNEDIPFIVNYWATASAAYLLGMGADPEKMPESDKFEIMLNNQIKTPYDQKNGFAMIWRLNGQSIGHNNVNKIVFGDHAYMHLHIWDPIIRRKGLGFELLKLSIPYFFENLKLETLYCEPFAENPAPNKLLEKLGFEFVKEYETIPGPINLLQKVKRWELKKSKLPELIGLK